MVLLGVAHTPSYLEKSAHVNPCVSGLGLRIWGLEFRVVGLGCKGSIGMPQVILRN